MSTLRPNRAMNVNGMCQHYRLNLDPHRENQKHVDRPQKVDPPIIETEHEDETGTDVGTRSRVTSNTDEDFETEEDSYYFDDPPTEKWNGTNVHAVVSIYKSACRKLGVVSSTSVQSSLLKPVFSQKYVQIKSPECKAMCLALMDNIHVHKIEFDGNGLDLVSLQYISDVMAYSSFITHVSITDNNLKSDGARVICDTVSNNKMIEFLDISGNGLVERDGKTIKAMLDKSDYLTDLYLARNHLMDVGVKEIADAIESSHSLKLLDLQWNHIRLGGAVALGKALKSNRSIEVINLAWNGLHMEGAEALAAALKKNDTLKEMDLTCNRLNEECIAKLLTGLDRNKTLQILRLGQNHITPRGAESILRHIIKSKRSGIKLLDFGSQEVKDTFVGLVQELQEERGVHVIYGMVWDSRRKSLTTAGVDTDEVALLSCNPLTVLMECMRLQNLRLIDFFKSLDTNKSNLICITELYKGLLKIGIPIRPEVLMKLLRRLDQDNNDMLDFGEMINAHNLHRQKLRRALQAADSDFDKTDIGKVSAILRRVMENNYVMKRQRNDPRAKTPKRHEPRSLSTYDIEEVETKMNGDRPRSGAIRATNRKSSAKTRQDETKGDAGISPDKSKSISRDIPSNGTEPSIGRLEIPDTAISSSGTPGSVSSASRTSSASHRSHRPSSSKSR